jgi:hypothetical protein
VSNVNNPGLRGETAKVSLHYNPEPTFVKIGRPLLYEAKRSGHGGLGQHESTASLR